MASSVMAIVFSLRPWFFICLGMRNRLANPDLSVSV